jgi:tetratricopeptide (TPR) repeat protein
MGALYLARDPQLDRLVAIKLLKEDLQDDSELRERFLREARSVARLRHSNIVIVHDVGEDEGRSFMAMEYIAGETLAQIVRKAPVPPFMTRLAMVEDLCAGLAHAHGAGIIHRDIKPANIMIDADGVLKILDFGIARLGDSGMTQEGRIMGSVNYMSPEQVVGRGVDHRTDIFAAGTVLYEVITLAQAFPGGVDSGVLHRILHEGPAPLEQFVTDIDPELAGIVQRAMARDPGQRYQDVNVMRQDLIRVRRRLANEGPDNLYAPTLVPPLATAAPTMAPGTRRPDSDQQAAEHVRLGEEALALGEYDTALAHADRAASSAPGSREAANFRDKVRTAIEAKATAARVREERIKASLEHARSSIDRGGYETALRAVYEVLALDPDRAEARALEQQAQAQIQARRQATENRPSVVSQQTHAPVPVETPRRSSPVKWFVVTAATIVGLAAIGVGIFVWTSPTQSGVRQNQPPARTSTPAPSPASAPSPVAPAPSATQSQPPATPVAAPPPLVKTAPRTQTAPPGGSADPPISTRAPEAPATRSAPVAEPPPVTQAAPAPAPTPAADRAPAPTTTSPLPSATEIPLPPALAAARSAQLLNQAAQAEKAGDFATALRTYERVRTSDSSLAALATGHISRVQTLMHEDGLDAFKRAQQYDAAKRVDDALAWYERAFRNLPENSAEKRTAADRIRALKSGR